MAVSADTASYGSMKKIPLWGYGIIFIGVGAFVSQTGPAISGPMTPEEQGEAIGRGAVVLLAWIIGLTLIVISAIKVARGRRSNKRR
jgi:hypothetical protein